MPRPKLSDYGCFAEGIETYHANKIRDSLAIGAGATSTILALQRPATPKYAVRLLRAYLYIASSTVASNFDVSIGGATGIHGGGGTAATAHPFQLGGARAASVTAETRPATATITDLYAAASFDLGILAGPTTPAGIQPVFEYEWKPPAGGPFAGEDDQSHLIFNLKSSAATTVVWTCGLVWAELPLR